MSLPVPVSVSWLGLMVEPFVLLPVLPAFSLSSTDSIVRSVNIPLLLI